MKYLLDFLENKKIEETLIYKDLNCSLEECKILQYITKEFILGNQDLNVSEILIQLFGSKNYEHVKKLHLVRSLIDVGWLINNSFSSFKPNEATNLEILNGNIGLSNSFLKILEDGKTEFKLPEINAYEDHLEYLKDQFLRLDLYRKLSQGKQKDANKSPLLKKYKTQLLDLEYIIEEKLKITKIEIPIENLMQENSLSQKEKIIFLALVKEEYSVDMENLRDINSLISLISKDDYEKIKNRNLLEEGSKLLDNNLVDYDEILTAFGGVSRSFYINEEVLQKIMHPEKEKKSKKAKLDMLIDQQNIFELVESKTSLDDVVMNPKTKEVLDNLLKQLDRSVIARLKEWGIKKNRRGIDVRIMLYGPPGTGKTMTAVSLAKSLRKRLLSFDCSKILSKYVGESEQNVRKIFDTYKDICRQTKTEPILLLNEADQFLSTRSNTSVSSSDKMHNQMQNIFLEQIEKFEGILIATTNFLESLDSAFSRRFDYKIEFKKPNFNERLNLWRRILPENAVYEENFDIEKLAKFPLNGGQIVLVLKNTAMRVAVKKEAIFTMNDFYQAIERETSGAFGELKIVGFNT